MPAPLLNLELPVVNLELQEDDCTCINKNCALKLFALNQTISLQKKRNLARLYPTENSPCLI
jgi:hypothetical protein